MLVAVWTLLLMAPLVGAAALFAAGRAHQRAGGQRRRGRDFPRRGRRRPHDRHVQFHARLHHLHGARGAAGLRVSCPRRKRPGRNTLFAVAAFGAFVVGALVSGSRTAVISSGLMVAPTSSAGSGSRRARPRSGAAVRVVAGSGPARRCFALSSSSGAIRSRETALRAGLGGRGLLGPRAHHLHRRAGRVRGHHLARQRHRPGLQPGHLSCASAASDVFALAEVEAQPDPARRRPDRASFHVRLQARASLAVGIGKSLTRRLRRLHSRLPDPAVADRSLAVLTWSAIGQLTAHGLLGHHAGLRPARLPVSDGSRFFPLAVPLDVRLLHLIPSVDPRGGGTIEGVLRHPRGTRRARPRERSVSLDDPAGALRARLSGAGHGARALDAPATCYNAERRRRGCASARCRLRRGDRQRPLAVHRLRRVARLAAVADALFRLHARHARSVVQAPLSAQAPEEMAVLALGANTACCAMRPR